MFSIRSQRLVIAAVVIAGTWFPLIDGSGQVRPAAADTEGADSVLAPSASWLETVNFYRVAAGLAPLVEEPAWTDGIDKHLVYLAKTPPEFLTGQYANAHTENPQSPWYTAEGDEAGRSSNLGGGPTERVAVEGWMSGPFHAIGILRPGLRRSAFAERDGVAGLDVIRGLDSSDGTSDVLFPGDRSRVPLQWFTGESPDPLESCSGFSSPSGLPLIAMLAAEPPGDTTATLTLPDGTTLATGRDLCVVTPSTYFSSDSVYGEAGGSILRDANAALIIARAPLTAGTHRATLTSSSAGTLADWSFTIVSPPSDPQDVSARRQGDGTVRITWQPPANDGASRVLEYFVSVVPPDQDATTRTRVSNDQREIILSRIPSGSYVYVVASNGFFESPIYYVPIVGIGYWMLDGNGLVYPFGELDHYGNGPAQSVDIEPTADGLGYWVLAAGGQVVARGSAQRFDGPSPVLDTGELATSISARPNGDGYWIFTSRGRVFPFGSARHHGDMGSVRLNQPVVGSVSTPTGLGYYMVAADGGIFSFGDANFAGSMGGRTLTQPVRALVPDPDGAGYWLVASDGGVFAFDAVFRGSMGGTSLNRPVVGMVAFGNGYLMVGADGGIFNFSDRPYFGSLGNNPPPTPVVAAAGVAPQ